MSDNVDTLLHSSDMPYKVVIDLDDKKYSDKAQSIVQLFVKDIDRNGQIDFDKVLETVRAHNELAVMGTIKSTLKESKQSLVVIIGKVLDALRIAGAMGLSGSGFQAAMEEIFSDLKGQQGKPWFRITDEVGTITYTYNLLHISHSAATGSLFAVGLFLFHVSTSAPVAELLGREESEKKDSIKTPQVQYEKYEFEIEIKGVSIVRPIT